MNDFRLPVFKPVTQDELRRIWTEQPCPEARRLVLEVERYRRAMAELDQLFQTIHTAWKEQGGGHLIAMHLCKKLLYEEKTRVW